MVERRPRGAPDNAQGVTFFMNVEIESFRRGCLGSRVRADGDSDGRRWQIGRTATECTILSSSSSVMHVLVSNQSNRMRSSWCRTTPVRQQTVPNSLCVYMLILLEDDDQPLCSVTVTSIALQSFTFTEFFFRCSSAFPQVKKEGKTSSPTDTSLDYIK